MNFIKNITNIKDENSITTKIRRENFELFRSLVSLYDRKVKILDLGGTQEYWEMMKFTDNINVTLVNLEDINVTRTNFTFIKEDIFNIDLKKFDCDIIFSHSLIEHINHEKFAEIIRNSNKTYFIQTPNKYFPFEPHFLMPLIQFFPVQIRFWLVKTLRKEMNPEEVKTIKLLSKKDLIRLFPNSEIYGSKIFGIRQSFIATERK